MSRWVIGDTFWWTRLRQVICSLEFSMTVSPGILFWNRPLRFAAVWMFASVVHAQESPLDTSANSTKFGSSTSMRANISNGVMPSPPSDSSIPFLGAPSPYDEKYTALRRSSAVRDDVGAVDLSAPSMPLDIAEGAPPGIPTTRDNETPTLPNELESYQDRSDSPRQPPSKRLTQSQSANGSNRNIYPMPW
jgi:hypothetical protein